MILDQPGSSTPIRQALARLIRAARGFTFLRPRPTPTQTAPSPIPTRATTLARTTEWLVALARVLAGDRLYHHPITFPRFPGRYPSLTAQLREEIGLPALPPPTEAHRAATRLHYIRKIFATQPTGVIAARLARRLGLKPTDAAWPHALIAITTPPAKSAPALRPGRRPRDRRPSPFRPLPPIPPLRLAPRHIPPLRRVPQRE